MQGFNIQLQSQSLGGIRTGAQILYKQIPIGKVYRYQLDNKTRSVSLFVSIDNEYRHIINDQSRFWNISSVRTELNYKGLAVKFGGLKSLINGAIAVDSPTDGHPIAEHATFKLYPDLQAAGRGISIRIALPEHHDMKNNTAPIMYRGIKIGHIKNIHFDSTKEKIIANAAIQPSFGHLLNHDSKFIIEEATVSMSGFSNLANVVTGNFLTLVPGKGQPARNFTAIRQSVYRQPPPNTFRVTLTAKQTHELAVGNKVKYRGVNLGEITQINLDQDNVQIVMYIDKQYQYLMKDKNRFYVTGTTTAAFTDAGIEIDFPPFRDIIIHSISFISKGKPTQKYQHYHLYSNKTAAELAQYTETGAQKYTLISPELPSIQKNTPILYRNIKVGHVMDFRLKPEHVMIDILIDNQYKHLINKDTVFWNTSGFEFNASLKGIKLKTGPLSSMLYGGIAFDTLPDRRNKQNHHWILYSSYEKARHNGMQICLNSKQSYSISPGTPVNYQGVRVGDVTTVSPDFKTHQVNICADIYPNYVTQIARKQSYFWVASVGNKLTELKNIKSVFSQSIEVFPGNGTQSKQFTLNIHPYIPSGLKLILQSNARDSIDTGTAITYRGIQVGQVSNIRLGDLADRVIITANIRPKYAYLIRKNTVFWNQSGIDMSVGLTGADIRTGDLDSLLNGSIAFNTPDHKPLALPAENLDAFYLYPSKETEWANWHQPIPKPSD
jgi:paraquat-inducible protein B